METKSNKMNQKFYSHFSVYGVILVSVYDVRYPSFQESTPRPWLLRPENWS